MAFSKANLDNNRASERESTLMVFSQNDFLMSSVSS